MKKKRKSFIGVLVSGGLDSAVMLARLARRGRVVPVYVRSGLRWEKEELAALRRFVRRLPRSRVAPLEVLELPIRDAYGPRHWSTGGKVPSTRAPDEARTPVAPPPTATTWASATPTAQDKAEPTLGAFNIWSGLHFVINSLHVVTGASILVTSLVLTLRAHRSHFTGQAPGTPAQPRAFGATPTGARA